MAAQLRVLPGKSPESDDVPTEPRRGKTQMLALRLPVTLLGEVDGLRGTIQARLPGVRVSRSDVVRMLIEDGVRAAAARAAAAIADPDAQKTVVPKPQG